MIKFGITTISGLINEIKSPTRLYTKQVSIPLLTEVRKQQLPNSYKERILLELTDDRGAYKRTSKNRFDQFDQDACKFINDEFKDKEIRILDCAVSDASTSVDFFKCLNSSSLKFNYLATDYDPTVKLLGNNGLHLTLSSNLDPLQLVYKKFVFNLVKKERWRTFPINRIILEILTRTKLKKLLTSLHHGELKCTELSLYCTEALKLSEEHDHFELGQLSILDKMPANSYSVIRMMNVLNPAYFSNHEFNLIFANAFQALTPGGLLIAGSNQDAGSTLNGGIYQKTGDRFQEIYNSGNGLNIDTALLLKPH